MEPESDEAVLARSLNAEPEAFEILVERYERRIYGLLWRLSSDRSAIDDLYQQVWLKAWNGRISFKGNSRFGTWLYAIAMNEVRAWRRRAREYVPIEDVPAPVAKGPSALDRLLGRARKEALASALDQLAAADRESLVLRFQQGLDYEEIARLTKSNLAQARLRNFRAIRRLKELLKDREL
jgi:RNA polymerase sigma-70 factor (ECF subfamily)